MGWWVAIPRIIRTTLLLALCLTGTGCPRVVEDALEPNDTPGEATVLVANTPLTGRAVQGDRDVFTLDLRLAENPGESLQLDFESLGGDAECATFRVTGPDGSTLYADTNRYCSRYFDPPIQIAGATLVAHPVDGYALTIPVIGDGVYTLTIEEKGHADNLFDYFWDYRLIAQVIPSAP